MLEVDDLAPVQLAVLLGFVEVGARAGIEVGVVVAADDNDVAVAFAGAVPGFLQGLEPVYAALNLDKGALVSEVAGVNEEVAWWEAFGRDLGVGVGDADTADGGAESVGWRRFVGGATKVQ